MNSAMVALEKKGYHRITEPLKSVAINNLFARSVVEGHVSGTVYVDSADGPKTYHVVHPYGMSLLFGESGNGSFNSAFRDYALNVNGVREGHEWLQAYPAAWDAVLRELFAGQTVSSAEKEGRAARGVIELNTRVNFIFDPDRYPRAWRNGIPDDVTIAPTGRKTFAEMPGSVVPRFFWDSVDDFLARGAGFSLFYRDKLAATAYASFVLDHFLELGIETVEEFRGRGFGLYACCALIDHCLERGLEPVWACRLENTASYKLALKLGFEPAAKIPYYRLSN